MAVATILSTVLEKLTSFSVDWAREELSLVGDVEQEVNRLTNNFQAIQHVLIDAEQRQVREVPVRFWLDQLKDMCYDMEDVLDEWKTQRLELGRGNENADLVSKMKVCFFWLCSCFGFKEIALRRDIGLKIKELKEKLDDIARQGDTFNFKVISSTNEKPKREESTSLVEVSDISGRDFEKKTLVNMLLSESSDPQQGLRVISIVGMGGIGKTTLAQLAYNDDEIIRNFHQKCWVCVSDPFDKSKIAKAILESFKRDALNLTTLESLLKEVRKSVVERKFFLVLDDVWTENYTEWEPLYKCLKDGLPGSKILVTTRMKTVARAMHSYSSDILNTKELPNDECWSFFKKLAFFDRALDECEDLEEIGRKIVSKCKGLPLAVKTMGSFLRHKETREEWQSILDDEMWKLESFERGIFPPLLLSYNDLPPMVKSCFIYCAIFPKDWKLNRNELIHLWMAQSYLPSNQNREMEAIGKEYFDILATRSFFQEFKKDEFGDILNCKMHDIVHDVALFLSRNKDNDSQKSSGDFSHVKTGHLMLNMSEVGNYHNLRASPKKLRSLLIHGNLYSNENDQFPLNMEQLTHLRTLRFVCDLVKEIPREITKLIYLRYLHLIVGKDMKALPDTLCELYNLQTLRVEGGDLLRLPLGMEKLIKLRHLQCSRLKCMPKGIERLTCLQTLRFVVNSRSESLFDDNDSDDNNNACTLEALNNLMQLRSLNVDWLAHVQDANEIERAQLGNKRNLVELRLHFGGSMVGDDNHGRLLRAFHPSPPYLETLQIDMYRGNIGSLNWMMSVSTLKKLKLSKCENWERLPPLGSLPCLESLIIDWMTSIKRVGNEFLGLESRGSSSSSNIIIFRKLKSLKFYNMRRWEEWDYGITKKDGEDITIMPHLRSLKIGGCPRLRVWQEELLQRATLEEFRIEIGYFGFNPVIMDKRVEWWKRREAQRPSTSS